MVSPRWGSLANDVLLVIFRLYEADCCSTGSQTVDGAIFRFAPFIRVLVISHWSLVTSH
jgi:hypothetical protein